MYAASGIGLGFVLIALIVLEPIERRLFPAERFKHLDVEYSGSSDFPEKVRQSLLESGISVQSVDVEKNAKKGSLSHVRFLIRIPVETDLKDLYRLIKSSGNVEKVELSEKF